MKLKLKVCGPKYQEEEKTQATSLSFYTLLLHFLSLLSPLSNPSTTHHVHPNPPPPHHHHLLLHSQHTIWPQ